MFIGASVIQTWVLEIATACGLAMTSSEHRCVKSITYSQLGIMLKISPF